MKAPVTPPEGYIWVISDSPEPTRRHPYQLALWPESLAEGVNNQGFITGDVTSRHREPFRKPRQLGRISRRILRVRLHQPHEWQSLERLTIRLYERSPE